MISKLGQKSYGTVRVTFYVLTCVIIRTVLPVHNTGVETSHRPTQQHISEDNSLKCAYYLFFVDVDYKVIFRII